jgi:hypothetical protein
MESEAVIMKAIAITTVVTNACRSALLAPYRNPERATTNNKTGTNGDAKKPVEHVKMRDPTRSIVSRDRRRPGLSKVPIVKPVQVDRIIRTDEDTASSVSKPRRQKPTNGILILVANLVMVSCVITPISQQPPV